MSYTSAKGYRAERDVREYLNTELGMEVTRGVRAGNRADRGDIQGLPIVISVKDHDSMRLGPWVDALPRMIEASKKKSTGVVWHKRAGRASPRDWFVTTSATLFAHFTVALNEHRIPALLHTRHSWATRLSRWTDDLVLIAKADSYPTGLIVHANTSVAGGDPYVSTTGGLFIPILKAYMGVIDELVMSGDQMHQSRRRGRPVLRLPELPRRVARRDPSTVEQGEDHVGQWPAPDLAAEGDRASSGV